MFKNGIDPRIVTIFGVWTSILLMVANAGPAFLDGALPPAMIPFVLKWCSILGMINGIILTGGSAWSSNKSGPMIGAPPPTSFTPTVVKILIAALVLSMFLPSASTLAALLHV